MAELVHCNSCGGSFRYDPPQRRDFASEWHDAGDPVPMRCRRCWRDVDSPPPRAPMPAHVQQPVERSVADFAALMEREVAAGHRYYDKLDAQTQWSGDTGPAVVGLGDYLGVEGLAIAEASRRG